ncbi:MAG TPA: hypothetical protein GXX61_07240 [Bacteroidales bacterium]|nr:hypothetical protein [Bacteroidales bacterium]
MVTVTEVVSKSDKRKFIRFPLKLYKDSPWYVPEFTKGELYTMDPLKNPAFEYLSCKLFLAWKGKKIVGRVAAILNNAHNYSAGEKQIRFTRFDFIDDYEVSQALFNKVIEWAQFLGMNEIVGPLGFSYMDKIGMLIEGFEEMDLYSTQYNYSYYPKHMERIGLQKKTDWVEFQVQVPDTMPEKLERVAKAAKKRYGYSVRTFDRKKDMLPVFEEVLPLLNDVIKQLEGITAISETQMGDFAKTMMPLLRKEFITVVQNKDNEVVGYGLMMPSISRGVRLGRGRMFPLGMLGILRDVRKVKVLDMFHIGVLPAYQNRGVNGVIMHHSIVQAMKHGILYAETGPEREDNISVQSQWKHFEHRQHRRRRCYTISI